MASWHHGTPSTEVVAASAPVILLASCGMAGVVQPQSASPAAGAQPSPARTSIAGQEPERTAASRPQVSARGPVRTSCRAVVHIGDSTSEGPHLARLPAEPAAADFRPVRTGGRDQVHSGNLGRPVDRRDLRWAAERLYRCPAADTRGIPRMLGARAGNQRHRGCIRRLAGQPSCPDRADDVSDWQPACHVGERYIAARQRAVLKTTCCCGTAR